MDCYNKTIGEDQQLYTMLSNPSSVLEILIMWGTQLSSTAATDLFTSLRNNHKLKSSTLTTMTSLMMPVMPSLQL